jgi:hypothetical protein
MVGSENTEPANGWPYDLVSAEIVNNPFITPEELSKRIVEDYINSYRNGLYYVTQSAIDLSKVDNLAGAVDNLSSALDDALVDNLTIVSLLRNAVYDSVQRFDSNGDGYITTSDSYVDLDNLSQTIAQYLPQFKSYTTAIQTAYNQVVVANGYIGADLNGSTGLSIWYPDNATLNSFEYHYVPLGFAQNTSWLTFLNDLWQ